MGDLYQWWFWTLSILIKFSIMWHGLLTLEWHSIKGKKKKKKNYYFKKAHTGTWICKCFPFTYRSFSPTLHKKELFSGKLKNVLCTTHEPHLYYLALITLTRLFEDVVGHSFFSMLLNFTHFFFFFFLTTDLSFAE